MGGTFKDEDDVLAFLVRQLLILAENYCGSVMILPRVNTVIIKDGITIVYYLKTLVQITK